MRTPTTNVSDGSVNTINDPLELIESYADVPWMASAMLDLSDIPKGKQRNASWFFLMSTISLVLDVYNLRDSMSSFDRNIKLNKLGECNFGMLASIASHSEAMLTHMYVNQLGNGLSYDKSIHRDVINETRDPFPESLTVNAWDKFKGFSDEVRERARDQCRVLLENLDEPQGRAALIEKITTPKN